MLPCDEVRELAEEYVSGTLEGPRCREMARHLRVCQPCHRAIEEARLAQLVLHETGAPTPPPRLADRIKLAAFTRLTCRPRPLHERALGSPAFLATCASLLCGAIICLLAIMRVASVQPAMALPPPQVEIVAQFKLPLRDIATTTVAERIEATQAKDPVAVERQRPAALMNVIAKPTPQPPPPAARRPVRPQRALMAVAGPAPHMGLSPTLPMPTVMPAGERTSRPDMVHHVSFSESAGPRLVPISGDGDDHLEFTDLAVPQPPARGDFTSAR